MVAKGVVDFLEMVEVEQQQRDLATGLERALGDFFEALMQPRAIRQPCEHVVSGLEGQAVEMAHIDDRQSHGVAQRCQGLALNVALGAGTLVHQVDRTQRFALPDQGHHHAGGGPDTQQRVAQGRFHALVAGDVAGAQRLAALQCQPAQAAGERQGRTELRELPLEAVIEGQLQDAAFTVEQVDRDMRGAAQPEQHGTGLLQDPVEAACAVQSLRQAVEQSQAFVACEHLLAPAIELRLVALACANVAHSGNQVPLTGDLDRVQAHLGIEKAAVAAPVLPLEELHPARRGRRDQAHRPVVRIVAIGL